MPQPLILVDAYSQIYRGFYAIPGLANSKGEPTNAVFAVAKLLISLEKDFPAEFGAFVYDLGRPAHRLEIAPQYKATRPPMPEDLKAQLPGIRRLVAAFGWPIMEKDGWEADDLIAGFAAKFADLQVRIVSSDKDLAQIVDERVNMLVPDKKSGGFMLWKRDQVLEKFDVAPEQIIDYLSMTGDSSDNIPGVEGVGPKTAAKLLHKFGSVEAMLARTAEIDNEKLRDKIQASSEFLIKNKKMIAFVTALPESAWEDISALKKAGPDWNELETIASELEMKSLMKDISSLAKSRSAADTGDLFQQEGKKEPPKVEYYTPDLF